MGRDDYFSGCEMTAPFDAAKNVQSEKCNCGSGLLAQTWSPVRYEWYCVMAEIEAIHGHAGKTVIEWL